ncbi:MAG: homoserine dehydrogenase [Gammaproteobacteria bacterium]|nr:homoserine dehydrogenase [Gammaproteobacteria bacterium]
MEPVKVGLLGLGTVGGGTANVLSRNAEEISRRAGRDIIITHASARDISKPRLCDTSQMKLTENPLDVVSDPDVEIIVELIGGDTLSKELVLKAIANKKHVVTANKALIAKYGNEIFSAAQKNGVMVAFEAAVAGGIPIIKALREGLAGNTIDWLAGIINGTGNFILTEMEQKQRDFADVLAEAQRLGYAEADPTFDVEGIDAAHKLTILASIAFGIPLQFDKVYCEGISKICREDVEYASELGYTIKHLGVSRRTDNGIELRVHPTLISRERLIANVNGVMNAVLVHGDAVGPTLYYGAGAGSDPTASAVVADIIDVVRVLTTDSENRVPHLAFQPSKIQDMPILAIDDIETAYYCRLTVDDRAGVLAEITRIFAEFDISIVSMVQKELHNSQDEKCSIVLITHKTIENKMNSAISQIQSLECVDGEIVKIRLEELDG